jgi:hypothetical protein
VRADSDAKLCDWDEVTEAEAVSSVQRALMYALAPLVAPVKWNINTLV